MRRARTAFYLTTGAASLAYFLSPWGGSVFYPLLAFATALACFGAAGRSPQAAGAWYALAAGALLWAIGDSIYVVIAGESWTAPFPSPADVSYALGYAAFVVAAGILARVHLARRRFPAGGILELAVLLLGAAVVVWELVLEPVNRGASLESVVATGYPALDAIVAATLLQLYVWTSPRARPLGLLAAGFGVTMVADVAYARELLSGWGIGDAALDRLRREQRIPRSLTFAELVEVYLAQHDVQPVTTEKLRWLLSKATAVFGDRRIGELTSQEIAEWRMNLSPGYRFEATQAVRQTLGRAVVWGMLDINPAKVGVDNPTPRRKEQHPFESWEELEAVAAALGERYGPMILFAAATGLRPAEWVALEWRDIDRDERVAYVRRSYTRRELKLPKTEASLRAVPLQGRAIDALDQLAESDSPLVFPGERGGYLDMHNFRPHQWRPAQKAAGISRLRRVYDLRHTFATFALRAGISTFDLSRYMGASLTMIDRHYGHLARDGREHAIKLLDALNAPEFQPWTLVDAGWTSQRQNGVSAENKKAELPA